MLVFPSWPLRLGVVTTSFPKNDLDPAGRFVHTHLRSWAARQENAMVAHASTVDVIAVAKTRGQFRIDLGTVYRIPSRGWFDAGGAPEAWESALPLARLGLAAEAVRVSLALAHEVRAHSQLWSEVHSHWLVPSAVAVALGAPHLRHTAFVHGSDIAALEAVPGAATLLRWLLPRLERVVCVSSDLADRLRRLAGPGWPARLELQVASMLADETVFGRAPAPNARNGIVAVGRLVPIKGFDVLLVAAGGLPKALRPRICLLGEGPERSRLASLSRRLDLRLDMPGAVPSSAVAQALASATVCVIPSRVLRSGRTEGFPVVAAEALACDTPVIASRVGGLAELGADNRVHLVPSDDPQGLRRGLAKLLRGQGA